MTSHIHTKSAGGTHGIEVDVYAADVGGADGGVGEEAVLPLADVHGALVDAEEALEPARDARPHAEQLA